MQLPSSFAMQTFVLYLLTIGVFISIVNAKRFFITRHGACKDCEFRGKTYQWCYLGTKSHDWDYCSTRPGYSARNEKCRSNHQCGFHGKSYLWCWLENGSWDYCSLIEDTDLLEYTSRGEECQNYCDLDPEKYVCRKHDQNSAECSPVKGVAANGSGCRSLKRDGENSCGTHSYSYSWCRTNDNSWGNCSNPQAEELRTLLGRKKRASRNLCDAKEPAMEQIHVFIQQLANDASLVTAIYAEPSNRNDLRLADGNNRVDAQKVLYRWHARLSSDRTVGNTTEQSNGRIRLDRQGITQTENYGNFLNWQLQINGPNQHPSSVAHVNIPETLQGYGPRGWRRLLVAGLHHSLNRGATVWIFQSRVDTNGKLQCPRRGN